MHGTGLSAVTLLLANSDIMGASGIVTSCMLSPIATISNVSDRWKFIFIGSFVATVNMIMYVGTSRDQQLLSPSTASPLAYAMGGFCVGIGTKLGNGCTSGHGVCGLGRLSPRSLVAVVSFLVSGILAATFISSPNTPWASSTSFLRHQGVNVSTGSFLSSTILLVSAGLATWSYAKGNHTKSQEDDRIKLVNQRKSYGAAISGAMFAIGLAVSGMSQTNKVQGFLDLNPLFRNDVAVSSYDATLLTVLGAAVPISALGYLWQRYHMKHTSLCGADWSCIPKRTDIDSPLVLGSVLFGVGWGLVGLCPGPAVWSAAAGVVDIVYSWFPAFLFGSFVGKQILNMPSKPKTN